MKPQGTQEYALPLELLLAVLQKHQHSYQLRATIPARLFPETAQRGESYQAELLITQTKIHTCRIANQQGQSLLEGNAALACLYSQEQLMWSVQLHQLETRTSAAASHSHAIHNQPASFAVLDYQMPWSGRPPPCLVSGLETTLLETLSRKQRLVLLLINGRRSMCELCTMLNCSTERLAGALDDLERQGLITTAFSSTARAKE